MSLQTSTPFYIEGKNATLRLSGNIPLEQATAKVTSAIAFTRDIGITNLLVLAQEMTTPPPASGGLFERAWISAASDSVRIGLVAPPDLIHPEMFGVTTFSSEERGLAWLHGESYRKLAAPDPRRTKPRQITFESKFKDWL